LTRKLGDALTTLRAERAIDKCHQDDIEELQGTVDKLECASDNLGLENCELKEQIKDLKIELRAVKRQKTGLQKERDNLVMERNEYLRQSDVPTCLLCQDHAATRALLGCGHRIICSAKWCEEGLKRCALCLYCQNPREPGDVSKGKDVTPSIV
jgi:hypothetical protein